MSDVLCGVYKIENKLNGKVYVGSSKDINKRWVSHLGSLKKGKHHSTKLQMAIKKAADVKNLELVVLELCCQESLLDVEQKWIDSLDSYKSGYNCSKSSRYPTNLIKESFTNKSKPIVMEIVETLNEFHKMSEVFPINTLVSFYGLRLNYKMRDTKALGRYLRALKLCIRIVSEPVEENTEYRLHYLHYSDKNGCRFDLTPEHNEGRNSKYSMHSVNKKPDLHGVLLCELIDCLTHSRMGRHILDSYKEILGFEIVCHF